MLQNDLSFKFQFIHSCLLIELGISDIWQLPAALFAINRYIVDAIVKIGRKAHCFSMGKSVNFLGNRVCYQTHCHKTRVCLTSVFWQERRCSLPILFQLLKLPLLLKRPVLKFSTVIEQETTKQGTGTTKYFLCSDKDI